MESKKCETCQFFRRYYFIERGQLRRTEHGYCKSGKLSLRENKKVPKIIDCPYWQQEKENRERNDTAQKVIVEMKRRLDELLLILKAE